MSDITPDAPRPSIPEEASRVRPSPTRQPKPPSDFRAAAVLTVLSLIALGVSTWELLRGDLSTGLAEISAGVALAAFGFTIYGVLRVILALIENAGERRRQTREFTERRLAERAEKPQ